MRRGFTLVEVVVVIAILGITAAAVVPALARVATEDDLTAATRQLETVFASARGQAVERATSVGVTLVPETGRYWTTPVDGAVLDSGRLTFPAGVRLQSRASRPTFRFDPLGTADGDSLVLVGTSGARAITVDHWTGELNAPAR